MADQDPPKPPDSSEPPDAPKVLRIHPVSREPRLTRLRALKCFDEVHQKILEGWMPMEIAKFIRDERQEYLDVALVTCIDAIKEYRSTIPPAQLIEHRLPTYYNKAIARLEEGVDEVKELEWVAKLQKRRLKLDNKIEKKIQKLMPSMTQEVRVMIEALRALADVKMDLGLSKRHLGELNVDATLIADVTGRYGNASIAKVLQNPESRQKVMGAAEKFLALAASATAEDSPADTTVDAEIVVPPPEVPASHDADKEAGGTDKPTETAGLTEDKHDQD